MIRRWKEKQLLGFSIKNIDELRRILGLGIVNMVELKPENFARVEMPLYFFEQGNFIPNHGALAQIVDLVKDVIVQFHLPIEKNIDGRNEMGLNIGLLEHHDAVIKKFRMFESICETYGLGKVLTVHPPMVFRKHKFDLGENEVLENARIFFEKLDAIRITEDHETLIGVENQQDPKVFAADLGYRPVFFKRMLKNTRTIGLTMDLGHRKLAREFSIREFIRLGIPLVNFHFHGNAGDFDPQSYSDDQHILPTPEVVGKGYHNYIRYFRRHRTPVVLEISHLERYSDEELVSFTEKLWEEMQ